MEGAEDFEGWVSACNTWLHPRKRSVLLLQKAAQPHNHTGVLERSLQVWGWEAPSWCSLPAFLKGFRYGPSRQGLLGKLKSPELRRKFLVWINTCLKGEMQGEVDGVTMWKRGQQCSFQGQGLGYVRFNTSLAGKAVNREVVIFASETKFNQGMKDKAWLKELQRSFHEARWASKWKNKFDCEVMEFGEDGENLICSFHPIFQSKAAGSELTVTAVERALCMAIGSPAERSAQC